MKKSLLLIAFLPCISNAQIINTYAGNGSAFSSGDNGPATAAGINVASGLAFDTSGNTYMADHYDNKICKVSPTGIITVVAGNGTSGYSGDGGQATNARLNGPYKLAIDISGNLYIADELNNRIRKINTSGIISTVAGNGTGGYSSDGIAATASELFHPTGVAVDHVGNIFIADNANNRVRKISASGIISTVAGNGFAGSGGDGGSAILASLYEPFGITVDGAGNLYIADQLNNKVRFVSTSGTISTFAGTGISGALGDGGQATAAQLDNPSAIAIDSSNNIYIADQLNNKVRKVTPAGVISTYVGTGVAGFYGDGGPAILAEINSSNEIAINPAGILFVGDNNNYRVRIITNACTYSITQQPIPDTVIAGSVAIFSVTTTMSSPVYQWQQNAGSGFVNLANVLPYSGVTTNTLTIHNSDMFLNATNYRCVITNDPEIFTTPCADTSDAAILIIDDNAGVPQVSAGAVSIFPNPAHEMLTISFPVYTTGYVQVINEIGQVIAKQLINGNSCDLHLEKYPGGLYLTKINWNGNTVYKKITKQ